MCMPNSKNKIVLIDGSGFIFRAYHALPYMSRPDGTPINAVYGFTKMISLLLKSWDMSHIAIIFDNKNNFRKQIYKEYKANRPPLPEDLAVQIPIIQSIPKYLNITSLNIDCYEADDVIASYATAASLENFEVAIISSDKDLMQLVDDNKHIYMFDPMKKVHITEDTVKEKFGVSPSQVVDIQSLLGDSIDNIPGVKGIGIKGASKLIAEYESLENLYSNIDNITSASYRNKLIEHKENAFISYKLAYLVRDLPNINLPDLVMRSFDPQKYYEFLLSQSFKSLAHEVAKIYNINTPVMQNHGSITKHETTNQAHSPATIHHLKNNSELEEATRSIKNSSYEISIYIDSENMCLIDEHKNIFYISLSIGDLLTQHSSALHPKVVEDTLIDICNDRSKTISSVHTKDLLKKYPGLQNAKIHDVIIIDHLVSGSTNKSLEDSYKNHFHSDIEDIVVHDTNDNVNKLAIQKNIAINLLYKHLYYQLPKYKLKFYYEYIEQPLTKILHNIEEQGIYINTEKFHHLQETIKLEMLEISQQIFHISNKEFNLASAQQVGKVLFDDMQLKGKKHKSGQWKTDISILESLSEQGVKIASLILQWRHLHKLQTTYIQALPKAITSNGTINTTFLQNSTSTGRLSSINPNLQNIPIKGKYGEQIRQAFISPKDYCLISLDYSQIELRVLAHMAKVENLCIALSNQVDIHSLTAKEIFKTNDVTPDLRRKAKAINFGIIYGISKYGLSKQLNIPVDEAQQYIDNYLLQYPEIKIYMQQQIENATKDGYIMTLLKRPCFIKNINHSNQNIKLAAQRAAINAPIQGTASEIMKLGMLATHELLAQYENTNIVLQIHDELLIYTPKNQANEVAVQVKNVLENIQMVNIPLVIDYNISNNWGK